MVVRGTGRAALLAAIRLALPVVGAALLCSCTGVHSGHTGPADRVPLDSNATRHVTTATGLRYHVVHSGVATGRMPVDGDGVAFDYEGKLPDGTVFDSSFAIGAPMTGQVGQFVPGFDEALKLMRPGDEWIVWIPPALGYGAEAKGPIPANSTLRFRMALRSVVPLAVSR